MAIRHPVGAFAIIPSSNLLGAVPFWERLGFERTGGDSNYIIMTGWGCEVHLTQAGEGPWSVAEQNNPFGAFIRTPDVDAIAARVDDLIIRPGGILRHREWSLYEVGVCGPDGLLVRIGWHTFRRTYRTLLGELKAPLEVQKALMRQADISTTLKYGQSSMENQRTANRMVVREIVIRRSTE